MGNLESSGGEPPPPRELRCDFCGEKRPAHAGMIVGVRGGVICHACVGVCNEIIASHAEYEATYGAGASPSPGDQSA